MCRFSVLLVKSINISLFSKGNMYNQAQASDQFLLATTKLVTNKAICLKAKKINKSKMYF